MPRVGSNRAYLNCLKRGCRECGAWVGEPCKHNRPGDTIVCMKRWQDSMGDAFGTRQIDPYTDPTPHVTKRGQKRNA